LAEFVGPYGLNKVHFCEFTNRPELQEPGVQEPLFTPLASPLKLPAAAHVGPVDQAEEVWALGTVPVFPVVDRPGGLGR
jgi:hypothetical protein